MSIFWKNISWAMATLYLPHSMQAWWVFLPASALPASLLATFPYCIGWHKLIWFLAVDDSAAACFCFQFVKLLISPESLWGLVMVELWSGFGLKKTCRRLSFQCWVSKLVMYNFNCRGAINLCIKALFLRSCLWLCNMLIHCSLPCTIVCSQMHFQLDETCKLS